MIDLEETERGIRAVDPAKNEVEIALEGWVPGGEEIEIDREHDLFITGVTEQVRVPSRGVLVESSELNSREFLNFGESICLKDGRHLFHFSSKVLIHISCESPVNVITGSQLSDTVLEFCYPSKITIGLRSGIKSPSGTICISPTPSGLADALNVYSTLYDSDSPDRSYPTHRPYPDLITTDDECPPSIEARYESQIKFIVPSSFDAIFPISPLAYYLGAEVSVENSVTPVLESDSFYVEFDKNENTLFKPQNCCIESSTWIVSYGKPVHIH